jgi:hypothetical protein
MPTAATTKQASTSQWQGGLQQHSYNCRKQPEASHCQPRRQSAEPAIPIVITSHSAPTAIAIHFVA